MRNLIKNSIFDLVRKPKSKIEISILWQTFENFKNIYESNCLPLSNLQLDIIVFR